MTLRANLAFVTTLAVALTGFGAGANPPKAPLAPPEDYGLEPIGWQVAPDLVPELKAMRAADDYRPHRDTTRLFVRSQLKYGLERDDYLHRWYDRPLLGDVRFAEKDDRGHFINVETWKRMAKLARLCGHGFAAFTCTGGRDDILSRSLTSGAESEVLVEIVGDCRFEGGKAPDLFESLRRIEEALRSPNAFRINGKVVITSYPRIRLDAIGFYAELNKEIRRRWGDKVALMPYFTPCPPEWIRPFDRAKMEQTKDELRKALRIVDGLCFAPSPMMNYNRRFHTRFVTEVTVPIIHSVLSEPEFRNKLLGMTSGCGHENCYRWNYAVDCAGTRTLRDCLKLADALRPDFVNTCEWDEENENTHHRPTVAQGFVCSRLLRYQTAKFERRAPEIWPGDDESVPNLVVSYRKALLAGEPIEVEVLNIPDGTFADKTFTVQLVLKNAAGKTVKTYPPQRLSANELRAAWFTSLATELLSEPVLKPELTVWCDGEVRTFSDGLWPLSLHVGRTLDFRWVKQALREKTAGVKSALAVGPVAADGTVEVKGFVESPVALRSVEVLDGPDTVFLYDPACPNRDQDGALAVRLCWQGLPWAHPQPVNGTIRIEGAPKARLAGEYVPNALVRGQEIAFVNARVGGSQGSAYVDIPHEEVPTAEFVVDVPPFFVGRIKASELLEKDAVSMPAEAGMNLVFRRWLAARRLLPPCGGKRAEFSFKMRPTTPDSVLRLQTIDRKYHVDYGAAHVFSRPTGRLAEIAVFERDAETVSRVRVDAGRLTPFDFDFSPTRGGVVRSTGGLGEWGLLCGYTPQVSGYGGGESTYGNVLLEGSVSAKAPGWPRTVPGRVHEPDGSWSLKFSDMAFVSLPQQVVPEYAGFVFELEANPDEVERKQGLFTTGQAYFNLGIEKGRVFVSLFLRNGYMHPGERSEILVWGPTIKTGEWSRIRVFWDRKVCRVDVNNKKGDPVKVSGDLFYPRHSALGVLQANDTFFKGRIRNVRSTVELK